MEKITCTRCSDIFNENATNSFDDLSYCFECYYEITFTCYGCGGTYHRDNENCCDNCEDSFCDRHIDDHGCNPCQNQQLVFQDGQDFKSITVKRYVAIELEGEYGKRRNLKLPPIFGIGDDGSLNSSGVEVTTPPSSGEALVKAIKLACGTMIKAGFEATDNCGLHVHIDLREIKDSFIKLSRVMRTFYAIEDVLFAMMPEDRQDSDFCYPLRNNYKFYDFYGSKPAKEFDCTIYHNKDKQTVNRYKQEHKPDARYRSFNFHSVFYRGTLECRLHEGTLDSKEILNWIELLLKVTDWSINHFNNKKIEELLLLPNNPKKIKVMARLFKFSHKTITYVKSRIKQFDNQEYQLTYSLGEIPKRKKK